MGDDLRFEEKFQQYKRDAKKKAERLINVGMKSDEEMGKESISAVRKNEDGNIIGIKTATGRVLDYSTALEEAKVGKLAHVDIFEKYGREILRSEPDGIKENNLDNLPEF